MRHWNSGTDLGDPLSLSGCQELRELEIYASRPKDLELALISSITSTRIQRITFAGPLIRERAVENSHIWPQLDDSLCKLVGRLECGIWLEVEFRALNAQAWWGGKHGFRKHLPKSFEKVVSRGG